MLQTSDVRELGRQGLGYEPCHDRALVVQKAKLICAHWAGQPVPRQSAGGPLSELCLLWIHLGRKSLRYNLASPSQTGAMPSVDKHCKMPETDTGDGRLRWQTSKACPPCELVMYNSLAPGSSASRDSG